MVPIHSNLVEMSAQFLKRPLPERSSVRCSMFDVRCSAFILILLFAWQTFTVHAAGTNSVLSTWIAAQANIHTWSAEVVQTRTLKSLTQPLTAQGHVWFEAPNRFRWELGNPPQTIAV